MITTRPVSPAHLPRAWGAFRAVPVILSSGQFYAVPRPLSRHRARPAAGGAHPTLSRPLSASQAACTAGQLCPCSDSVPFTTLFFAGKNQKAATFPTLHSSSLSSNAAAYVLAYGRMLSAGQAAGRRSRSMHSAQRAVV